MTLRDFTKFILFLCLCSLAPNSYAASEKTLLVHELDGVEYIIAPIDFEQKTVGKKQKRLGNGTTIYSKYIDKKYGLKKLLPGDYVIVNSLTIPNFSGFYEDTCFENFAPAFRVKPDVVNILPEFSNFVQGKGMNDNQLLDGVTESLKKRPKIKGEKSYVELLGYIDISGRTSKDVFRNACGSGKTFEFIGKDIESILKSKN